jgi:hypothetical protein
MDSYENRAEIDARVGSRVRLLGQDVGRCPNEHDEAWHQWNQDGQANESVLA